MASTKWTEATVKSWGKPKKRKIYQENNLQARVQPTGNISWFLDRPNPLSAKFLGKYPAVKLADARKLAIQEQSNKFLGTNPDRKLTFSEYVNSDLFVGEKNKERPSNKDSMRSLNNLICPVIGKIKMKDLTIKDIDKFKFGYEAKHSTINRLLNEIRAVLTHAHQNGVIETNLKIKNLPVRDAKTERRYLQQSEIDSIRQESRTTVDVKGNVIPLNDLPHSEYLKRGHLPLICDIAIFCGMRHGEILKLKYADITTWDESKDESWMFKLRAETIKTGKSRNVHLPEWLKNYIDKWWYENLSEEELAEVITDRKKKKKSIKYHNKRLFPYDSIQTSWENLERRAELPDDITFHSLRHHFCSNALLNGVPIQIVKEMAGHKSITTTEKYIHAIPSDSARLIQQYWKSVYRFEDEEKKIKKLSKIPTEIKIDDSLSLPLNLFEDSGVSIQFGTDFKFDENEYINQWLKDNPIVLNSKIN